MVSFYIMAKFTGGKKRLAKSSTNSGTVPTTRTREALQRELDAYLASGKKITEVLPGATGQDERSRSKHIVISRRPKQPT